MNRAGRWLRLLRWLLLLTVASSIAHYVDNLLYFEHYPEPTWLHPWMVDAFWFVMTPLAWIGYRLCRQGHHLRGSAVLLLYAGCNLLTLGHYRFAPFSHIAPRIHAYILLEAACACVLLTFLIAPYLRQQPHPAARQMPV